VNINGGIKMNWKVIKNERTIVFEAMVESESNAGTYYAVSYTEEDGWSCACPQYSFRHKECKHIREAKEMVGEYD